MISSVAMVIGAASCVAIVKQCITAATSGRFRLRSQRDGIGEEESGHDRAEARLAETRVLQLQRLRVTVKSRSL